MVFREKVAHHGLVLEYYDGFVLFWIDAEFGDAFAFAVLDEEKLFAAVLVDRDPVVAGVDYYLGDDVDVGFLDPDGLLAHRLDQLHPEEQLTRSTLIIILGRKNR